MMPEALHHGGRLVGLLPTLGFAISSLHLGLVVATR